jgi:hypothetical protein
MFFDGIIQLPPQAPTPAPTRHFLDKYTARICAGEGGTWHGIKTFSDFLRKGFTPKDNSHIKDIVKEILTYTPHLLAIFAPLYFNDSSWSNVIINTSAVILNYGIERYLAYSQQQEKRKAGDLFRRIVKVYELNKTIEVDIKARGLMNNPNVKYIEGLFKNCPIDIDHYIPQNSLNLNLGSFPYDPVFSYNYLYHVSDLELYEAIVDVEIKPKSVPLKPADSSIKNTSPIKKLGYFVTALGIPAALPTLQALSAQYLTALPYLPSFANFVLSMTDFINKQVQERTKSLEEKPLSAEAVNQQIEEISKVLSRAKVRFEQALSQQYV